ncbi:MAG: hypothetical protein F4162_09480 [Synechococcus sp. SB0676_bin_10]|uniref:Uncharacterized protein n=1 Tax=Synechococcus sp. SB0676_bin_10 TaxID=2604869 RepID=A0A6B1F8Q7_9SYNE|nr:hypothetical protein [Synechococcus sp. SB0676_bin_10]MYG63359.1 hypothetical protein [Synechococcus sp. SB0675_bin_7]MYK07197.1 hypothetical protein [Synechococcus sp. SB0670_bin_20]MYK86262.1 hypothetical protein [Synechococcus sp. SB0669_bin_7]
MDLAVTPTGACGTCRALKGNQALITQPESKEIVKIHSSGSPIEPFVQIFPELAQVFRATCGQICKMKTRSITGFYKLKKVGAPQPTP